MSALRIFVIAPNSPAAAFREPAMAIAAARAGAVGLIDLDNQPQGDPGVFAAWKKLEANARGGHIGLRCSVGQFQFLDKIEKLAASDSNSAQERFLILTAAAGGYVKVSLEADIAAAKAVGWIVVVEAIDLSEALLAQSCGANAVIAKGHEAAGRVGEVTTFVLLQQFMRDLQIAVFAQGGIGLHSAAAVATAGGAGLVLDSQLYLCRDANVSTTTRLRLERMDGSETTLLRGPQGQNFRLVVGTAQNSGRSPLVDQQRQVNQSVSDWQKTLSENVSAVDALVIGQDACFARQIVKVGGTVAGAIEAIQQSVIEQLAQAAAASSLSENSPLAKSHRTKYPIVQGAMTRVSDTSDFALKVAEGGALPFLALSLMRGPDIEKLLQETQAKLGSLSWGVGLLGFVPQALRQEQMAVVNRYKPPFAMIAGGRPDQAKAMEDLGTPTYLHVPSPLCSNLLSKWAQGVLSSKAKNAAVTSVHVLALFCGNRWSKFYSTLLVRAMMYPAITLFLPVAFMMLFQRRWWQHWQRRYRHVVSNAVTWSAPHISLPRKL